MSWLLPAFLLLLAFGWCVGSRAKDLKQAGEPKLDQHFLTTGLLDCRCEACRWYVTGRPVSVPGCKIERNRITAMICMGALAYLGIKFLMKREKRKS